jgi:hypothetical protein
MTRRSTETANVIRAEAERFGANVIFDITGSSHRRAVLYLGDRRAGAVIFANSSSDVREVHNARSYVRRILKRIT